MNNIQKSDLDIQLGNEKLEVKEFAKYSPVSPGKSKYKLLILNYKKEYA